MKFDKFNHDVPEQAEVRAHKRNHFTVTPIKDLAAWKAEQAALQAKWEAGRAERYAKAKALSMSILDGTTTPKLTDLEKAELEWRGARGRPNHIAALTFSEYAEKPALTSSKPSLKERVVSWCLKLLNDAFPS